MNHQQSNSNGYTGLVDKISDYAPDASSLKRILDDMDISLRYDVRLEKPVFKNRPADDFNSNWLRNYIYENYMTETSRGKLRKLKFSVDAWKMAIDSICLERQYDPFLEYIEDLPEWDNTPRLRFLFTSADTFHANTDNISLYAPITILVGAITRAYQPGYKLDEIVVIIGEQGIGKSAFLRQLLPRPEWFSDTLEWNATTQQQRESLAGNVIVEAAELVGLTRAEVSKVKAFITRQYDSGRLAYARHTTTHPRRCVIVGTTNEPDCLPMDTTGNRRFIPIVCERGFDVERYMSDNRDQLWAEALHEYRNGARPGLPRPYHQQQAENNAKHVSHYDEVADAIIAYLSDHTNPTTDLSTRLIANWISENNSSLRNITARKVGLELALMGYEKERKRVGTRNTQLWNKRAK